MTPSAEDLSCSNCGSTRRVRGADGALTCADCGRDLSDQGPDWRSGGGSAGPEVRRSRESTESAPGTPSLADALDVPPEVVASAAGLIRQARDAGLEAAVDDDAWIAAALVVASDDVDADQAASEAGVDAEAVRSLAQRLRDAVERA